MNTHYRVRVLMNALCKPIHVYSICMITRAVADGPVGQVLARPTFIVRYYGLFL